MEITKENLEHYREFLDGKTRDEIIALLKIEVQGRLDLKSIYVLNHYVIDEIDDLVGCLQLAEIDLAEVGTTIEELDAAKKENQSFGLRYCLETARQVGQRYFSPSVGESQIRSFLYWLEYWKTFYLEDFGTTVEEVRRLRRGDDPRIERWSRPK